MTGRLPFHVASITPENSVNKTLSASLAAVSAALVLTACGGSSSDDSSGGNDSARGPNILFVIMDDVGIDQMKVFGYGGAVGPNLH